MSSGRKKVYAYVFAIDDAVSTDERVNCAVMSYIRANGLCVDCESKALENTLKIFRTARGKPYLPDCPQIKISVSHSADYLVCAVSETEIGVDIERRATLNSETLDEATIRLSKIARRFFHLQEAEYVSVDPYQHFFKVWTAKESYVKYTGLGIDDHFGDFCVISEEMNTLPKADFTLETVRWSVMNVEFSQIELAENYILCACSGEPIDLTVCFEKEQA